MSMTTDEQAEMVARWFADKCKCPDCGSYFEGKRGLASHRRHCLPLYPSKATPGTLTRGEES